MDMKESQELKNTIGSLISKANAWDNVSDFFNGNDKIKPYYLEIVDKLLSDNCQSSYIMIVQTIEKLLDIIETLQDDINYYEDKL